jgi:glycosyltransferase 2 family protein
MSHYFLTWIKKWGKLLLRLVISIGLLWYVLAQTELSAIAESLRFVNWWWILAAFALLFVGKLLTGLRWQKLLIAHQLSVPLTHLVNSLFVGQFFNSFLPSTIGGDAIRVYDTAVYTKKVTRSLTALFLDRLIGMFALIILGVMALAIGVYLNADVAAFGWLIALSFAACLGLVLAIFNPYLAGLLDKMLRGLRMAKIAKKIGYATNALLELRQERRNLGEAFIISLLLQVNVVLYYYFCALALNLDIGLIYFFLFTPIVLIILLVPFSINGIGIREGSYVFFLGMIGTAAGDAIAFTWVSFGLMLAHGLIGGVIFALRDADVRQLKMDVMLAQAETE